MALRECEMEIFGHIGPFDDELILGDLEEAAQRIEMLSGLEAAQLILATYCRSDSVINKTQLDRLADALGVFVDDEDKLKEMERVR